MSYSLTGTPETFSPAWNPLVFYPNSSNKNLESFRYIVDVYPRGSTERLSRYHLAPRPDDGFGVADINQIVSTQVSYFLNQNLNGFSRCPENFYNYEVQFGEQYVKPWPFHYEGGSSGSTAMLVNYDGTVAPYIVGDQILVEQQAGALNTEYDGVYTVNYVTPFFGTYVVGIDVPFHAYDTTTGTTTYSDRRVTTTTGITSFSGTVFNGTASHISFKDYNSSVYNISSGSSKKFLTNVPNNYRVKEENKMWLNFYSTNTGKYGNKICVQTDYGTYVFRNIYSATSDTMMTVGVGVYNIEHFSPSPVVNSGTLPIFKNVSYNILSSVSAGGFLAFYVDGTPVFTSDDQVTLTCPDTSLNQNYLVVQVLGNLVVLDAIYTTPVPSGTLSQIVNSYSVTLMTSGQTATSETKTFEINRKCHKYSNVELYFIDRLGSLIPANFELNSSRSISIKKDEYQTVLGDLSGGKWTYNSTDGGRKVINTTIKQQLDIQSDFLTESECTFLAQLVTSPVVFIKEYGELWPVVIVENNYKLLTKHNLKNIPLKLTVEYANNDRIQNF